ncbi:MAG: flagellar hook-associated protein FlgK [Planctomycetota bacterium]|mgnify:CR=1 FL=1|nr:MAG: flagellar hook-associated protein FlgK [Planctomycetota bacterium]REJ87081.1 MAG: flagellar hook-associated protein FlgK [Planctomycetota bacterium]REK27001.1 MAG: flagellar hook-associated protein FlgK [Planctomycetota bacterium]REK47272.1 MAG: flagellar hook-associated protein FlgK [Planctomycetota bacterium]
MSLFGSIRMANNTLQAQQIGLQVVGQNIANVNTPGYIREEVIFEPAPAQRQGNIILGLGVRVAGVVQKIDKFLEDRLRGSSSDAANSDVQQQTYLELERLLGELGENDLSTSLNAFFSSISEVLNQPENSAIRNLAVLQGQTLTDDIGRLAEQVATARNDVNDQIISSADDINRLTKEIFDFNRQIAIFESSDISESDAVGLRDQRNQAIIELAELIDIQAVEQPSGAVNISINGEFIVNEVARRELTVVETTDRGQPVAEIQFVETGSVPGFTSGRVAGLFTSRDEVLAEFLDELDSFSAALAFEFNRVHSSGQGLLGYQELTGEFRIEETDEPLDAAGLSFAPENGSLQVLVRNLDTGVTETTDIFIDLDGLDTDTTYDDFLAALNGVDGLTASTTSDARITLAADAGLEFSFANDTSGLLAALGLNTFFEGDSARTIGIRQELIDDARLLAASGGGIGEDTDNAVLLADFANRELDSANGSSVDSLYRNLSSSVTQATAVARSIAEGDQVFMQSLESQRFATSGVNLDDEIVRMISYQRAYQAAARYIAEINELLEILVSI